MSTLIKLLLIGRLQDKNLLQIDQIRAGVKVEILDNGMFVNDIMFLNSIGRRGSHGMVTHTSPLLAYKN
jgi:hypothetical protein